MKDISNIPVIYEDEYIMVLDKPSGLLSVPAPGGTRRNLTDILGHGFYPCHRLDKETSGLVIYAKGKSIQEKMMDEFRKAEVSKTYIAFLQGVPGQNHGVIRKPIEGKAAQTLYKVIEKRNNFAIVEARPLTGRTNQIRIHFKHIGHPIVGESKFAFRKDFKLRHKRLCLHARALSFAHPVTGVLVSLVSAMPVDMLSFLEKHTH